MTVKEMQELLHGLSPDMEVLIAIGDVLIPVCPCDSEVVDMEFQEQSETVPVVVLSPCYCQEPEPIVDPNLN